MKFSALQVGRGSDSEVSSIKQSRAHAKQGLFVFNAMFRLCFCFVFRTPPEMCIRDISEYQEMVRRWIKIDRRILTFPAGEKQSKYSL